MAPTWAQVGDIIAAGSTSYTVTGLTPNTAYTYRLITENAGGELAHIGHRHRHDPADAATRVTGHAASDTTVVLNWTNITGNTGYLVEDSADDATWYTVDTVAANTTTDTVSAVAASTPVPFVADTMYYSAFSPPRQRQQLAVEYAPSHHPLLAAPAGLAASTVSTTAVTLNWTDDTGNGGYVVQRKKSTAPGLPWPRWRRVWTPTPSPACTLATPTISR